MDNQDTDAPALSPEEFIQAAIQAPNIAALYGEDDPHLAEIAESVMADYQMDKDSMADWFEQAQKGIDLAKLSKGEKDYPYKGAANVKYPLVTSAALQFNARAYPAIVAPDRVVKSKVWGDDPQGAKAARADRVSEHMSYQLCNRVTEWESSTDKLLTMLPIVGDMNRKWWFDTAENRVKCRLLDPDKFIVNSKATDLETAPRATEELPLYPNEIETRIRSGKFIEFEYTQDEEDEQAPQDFIEQHTRIDLDDDGYAEPYVITMHVETKKIVAIVADFREEDVQYKREMRDVEVPMAVMDPVTGQPLEVMQTIQQKHVTGIIGIKRGTHFVNFQFLPGMDGGFHGTGLGILLGDISSAINTIINMMLDAGHYATLGGGWIGSGMRMKGGNQRFRPGEWKQTPNTGDDIRKSIVPMTFPNADATMFQMLGMLIDAGREIASVKDVITGESKPNQTATATLALIEQGMMVFTAAYKRIFRSLKLEYKLIAELNSQTVTPEEYNQFHDMMGHNGGPAMEGQPQEALDPALEYSLADMDITPVADPQTVTKMQQAAKAQLIMQLAEQGLVDRGEALLRIAEAMDIPDSEKLAVQPDPMQQEMAMLGIEAAKADLAEKMAKIELTMAQVEETRTSAVANIAGAQNDMQRTANEKTRDRMNGLLEILKDERERLAEVLRASGRMERGSGDRGSEGGNGQRDQPQAGGAAIGLLGGAGNFGGPQGFTERGGMGGGLL